MASRTSGGQEAGSGCAESRHDAGAREREDASQVARCSRYSRTIKEPFQRCHVKSSIGMEGALVVGGSEDTTDSMRQNAPTNGLGCASEVIQNSTPLIGSFRLLIILVYMHQVGTKVIASLGVRAISKRRVLGCEPYQKAGPRVRAV